MEAQWAKLKCAEGSRLHEFTVPEDAYQSSELNIRPGRKEGRKVQSEGLGDFCPVILAHIEIVKTMDSPPVHDVMTIVCIQIQIPPGHVHFQLVCKCYLYFSVWLLIWLCFVTHHSLDRLIWGLTWIWKSRWKRSMRWEKCKNAIYMVYAFNFQECTFDVTWNAPGLFLCCVFFSLSQGNIVFGLLYNTCGSNLHTHFSN